MKKEKNFLNTKRKKNLSKKGFQISFAWLFAIVVGAFILFLAIYASTRVIDTGREVTGARAAAEIGAWLAPLELGFVEALHTTLRTQVDTRIYNRCNTGGNFGEQRLGISEYVFREWSRESIQSTMENRYIFSNESIEGREFYAFVKSFEFPYKVADTIYITSSRDTYCFTNGVPENIKRELENLNIPNINLEKCNAGDIKVCFTSGQGCNVTVEYEQGTLTKNRDTLHFATDALMYGAIFSDKETYECQVERLMMRTEVLLEVYMDKNRILQDCDNTRMNTPFNQFKDAIRHVEGDIRNAMTAAENLQNVNEVSRVSPACRLW